ncbi:MAG: DDE-type integrase/transposase/recombinase [Magnetococcales bacterium]|nr:DDE-type integrase/transposase/recombinase [Magnetococcales bacterium]
MRQAAPTPWYSARDLAALALPNLPGSERNLRDKAIREEWRSTERKGKGGGSLYHLSSLPIPAQAAWVEQHRETITLKVAQELHPEVALLAAHIIGEREKPTLAALAQIHHPPRVESRERGLVKYQRAPGYAQKTAEGRREILRLLQEYQSLSGRNHRKIDTITRFCELVEAHLVPLPESAADLKPTPRTLQRWEKDYRAKGIAGLLPAFGNRKNKWSLPELQQQVVVGMLVDHPHASISLIHEALKTRFGSEAVPSPSSVKRFRMAWIKKNASYWLFLTDPDQWRSKKMAAPGSMSQDVIRINQRWEMDSTPADVILSDGKRHQIIGVIDIYTRRVKFHVSRVSKSTAITSLIRRAILDWGVPEEIKTDNGQDYVAKHTVRVLEDLKIKQSLCEPFSPWMKPHIERVFRTFSHGIVELLPGFIGHNVADRKAIESRRSFANRLMSRKRDGEPEAVEIRLTPAELQEKCDAWCENTYHQGARKGLHGKTPFQKAAEWKSPIKQIENERALDLLLFQAPKGKETRTIQKKGIHADGRCFVAAELWGRPEEEEVRVLLDETDMGRAYVFTLDMEFICLAEDPEWTGVSLKEKAAAAKAIQNRVMKEGVKILKREARLAQTRDIHQEIQNKREQEAAQVVAFPTTKTTHASPAINAAAKAVKSSTPAKPKPMTLEQRAAYDRLHQEITAPKQATQDPGKERFLRAQEIERKISAGEAVGEIQGSWYDTYKESPQYKAMLRMAKAFPQQAAG